jgi:hypothetical protein
MSLTDSPQSSIKNWKSYFLDFFMIFLAVTLGFFAESHRNDLAEVKKANLLKKAIAIDMKKDIQQMEAYNDQIKFILQMIDRMDSLLDVNPKDVDQKDYYNTLINYSILYSYSVSDKSLNEAEAMGFIQNYKKENLGEYILKYQYFLKDLKLTEGLVIDVYMDYFKEIIPSITEPKLYRKVWTYPLGELESKKGITPVTSETRRKLDYFFAQATLTLNMVKLDADSVIFYADKIKDEIEK